MTTKTTDKYWSEIYDSGRDFSLIGSGTLTKLLSYAPIDAPKSCLDIGCGTGQLTRELFHRGYTCFGIDASKSAIRTACTLTTVPATRLSYSQFDVEVDDIEGLATKQFNLITCKLVYAFIKDKPSFLNKVKKLLTPGGIFVVITPHVDDTPAERQGIAVSEDEIKLLDSSFRQLDLYKDPMPGGALTYFIGQ